MVISDQNGGRCSSIKASVKTMYILFLEVPGQIIWWPLLDVFFHGWFLELQTSLVIGKNSCFIVSSEICPYLPSVCKCFYVFGVQFPCFFFFVPKSVSVFSVTALLSRVSTWNKMKDNCLAFWLSFVYAAKFEEVWSWILLETAIQPRTIQSLISICYFVFMF